LAFSGLPQQDYEWQVLDPSSDRLNINCGSESCCNVGLLVRLDGVLASQGYNGSNCATNVLGNATASRQQRRERFEQVSEHLNESAMRQPLSEAMKAKRGHASNGA